VRANTIIAGVNKGGTTSLFVALSAHRQVFPSSIKETRYFVPAMYGRPLDPIGKYEAYFEGASDEAVRLEATPAYFYGGPRLIERVLEVCDDPKIIVLLREPVSQVVAYFGLLRSIVAIPRELTLTEYVKRADAISDRERSTSPATEWWVGARGARYADYLPAWHDSFGSNLRVLFTDDLAARPASLLQDLGTWLGIDPEPFGEVNMPRENRSMLYHNRRLQTMALRVNIRFEPFFRRHRRLKRVVRAAYYRLNGTPPDPQTDPVLDDLRAYFEEPNRRLAAQLREMGVKELPSWLVGGPVHRPKATSA
jgi:hypothetical protein